MSEPEMSRAEFHMRITSAINLLRSAIEDQNRADRYIAREATTAPLYLQEIRWDRVRRALVHLETTIPTEAVTHG